MLLCVSTIACVRHIRSASGGRENAFWWVLWFYHVFRVVDTAWLECIQCCMVQHENAFVRLAAVLLGSHLDMPDVIQAIFCRGSNTQC
jgi:hypothetical protein